MKPPAPAHMLGFRSTVKLKTGTMTQEQLTFYSNKEKVNPKKTGTMRIDERIQNIEGQLGEILDDDPCHSVINENQQRIAEIYDRAKEEMITSEPEDRIPEDFSQLIGQVQQIKNQKPQVVMEILDSLRSYIRGFHKNFPIGDYNQEWNDLYDQVGNLGQFLNATLPIIFENQNK